MWYSIHDVLMSSQASTGHFQGCVGDANMLMFMGGGWNVMRFSCMVGTSTTRVGYYGM